MLELKAKLRQEFGRKLNKQRRSGQIPAVIYGHGIKSEPLYVSLKEFEKVLKDAGESTLVRLEIGSKKHNVLIHDIASNSLNGEILHIDFYEVRMDEKLKAKIPLVFVGESLAVKSEGGVLVKSVQEIEVEALPADLPKEILVDISSLKTFEDKIQIKDLSVAGSVKISAKPEEIVASVVPPRSEKELEEIETKAVEEVGEIKVVGEEERIAKAEAEGQFPEEKKIEEKKTE